jgi:hypothetical protein
MYRNIALTKRATLTVKVPASRWFATPLKERMPELARAMSEGMILKRAETMVEANLNAD